MTKEEAKCEGQCLIDPENRCGYYKTIECELYIKKLRFGCQHLNLKSIQDGTIPYYVCKDCGLFIKKNKYWGKSE